MGKEVNAAVEEHFDMLMVPSLICAVERQRVQPLEQRKDGLTNRQTSRWDIEKMSKADNTVTESERS